MSAPIRMIYEDLIDYSCMKRYFFPMETISRLSTKESLTDELISQEKPVVMTDAHLCDSALKWNVSYLSENIPGEASVYTSPNHIFKYFDDSKINEHSPTFKPPTTKLTLSFPKFCEALSGWKAGDDRLYLQQPLNNKVGSSVAKDFLLFNWLWLGEHQRKCKWGQLTSNLLLVGMEGNVTPVHYDEQQNFFCQLLGYKRCILFPPENYENLYPYPVFHPHDRQCQVDFEAPDFKRFPRLSRIRGYEAILGPGDVLYIPIYWWHHIESLPTKSSSPSVINEDDVKMKYTVSINFWYKGEEPEKIEHPLLPRQKLAVIRNIEKMLLETLRDPNELGPLLQAILVGRYNLDAEDDKIS